MSTIHGEARPCPVDEVLIEAIIEDPRGSTTRHHYDPARGVWVEAPHPHSDTPWLANYGYITGTHNPVDGDPLDALVLARDPLPTGTTLHVRPVGLLVRPDGDDKVLAVAAGDPEFGRIRRLADVPRAEIERIETWFTEWDRVAGEWRDETEARRAVTRCRTSTRRGARGA